MKNFIIIFLLLAISLKNNICIKKLCKKNIGPSMKHRRGVKPAISSPFPRTGLAILAFRLEAESRALRSARDERDTRSARRHISDSLSLGSFFYHSSQKLAGLGNEAAVPSAVSPSVVNLHQGPFAYGAGVADAAVPRRAQIIYSAFIIRRYPR